MENVKIMILTACKKHILKWENTQALKKKKQILKIQSTHAYIFKTLIFALNLKINFNPFGSNLKIYPQVMASKWIITGNNTPLTNRKRKNPPPPNENPDSVAISVCLSFCLATLIILKF